MSEGGKGGYDGQPKNVILLPEKTDHWYTEDGKNHPELVPDNEGVEEFKSKDRDSNVEYINDPEVLDAEGYKAYIENKKKVEEERRTGFGGSDTSNFTSERKTVYSDFEKKTKTEAVVQALKEVNFLNPNDEEKEKLNDRIDKIFSEQFRHGVSSVEEIDNAIAHFEKNGVRSSFSEDKIKLLRADRGILAEAVGIACRELTASRPDLESEFFLGPKHIDNLLCRQLTGLGGDISKARGVPEEIGKELDKLEAIRVKMKGGDAAESKAYVAILKKKIDIIAENDFEDQFGILVKLNEELEKYKETDGGREDILKMAKFIVDTRRKIGRGVDDLGEDYIPEGIDPITGETKEGRYYSRYDITAEMLAVSMQLMDPNGARFDAYRPTEWYKNLSKEQRDVIDVMMEVSMAASSTYYYGKEVDKILGSKVNFSFTSEKMRTLFDDNFKLVMSKMLNDLTEEYVDQNLHSSLRYKEGFWRIPVKSKNKESVDGELVWNADDKGWFLKDGVRVDEDGFLLGVDDKRIPLDEKDEYIRGIEKNGQRIQGKRGISSEVIGKLRMIEDYKGELAYFLAENMEDGFMKYYEDDKEGHKAGDFIMAGEKKIPKPIYKMYANTAWNLWYGMGDSSLSDRMRVLPTWNKIVSDGIRTMNPEGKLLSKLQIWKGGMEKKDSDLDEAEYFTGEMGQYILEVMNMESDLGHALKEGDKTMRRKILEGKVHILPDKTLYGFFDFVNGGRDLVQIGNERNFYSQNAGDNIKKTLGQFLLDYAYTGDKNNRQLIRNKISRNDFNFKKDQVSFMNEYADSWQAAILVNGYLMGKADPKDPNSWARAVKSSTGMMNGIKFNGERFFKYVNSPETWRAMIVACFKPDRSRLSSDYIPIVRPPKKDKSDSVEPYSFFIERILTKEFALSSGDVDLVRLAQLLGVSIERGQRLGSDKVLGQTNTLEGSDKGRTIRYVNRLINEGWETARKQENDDLGKKNDLLSDFARYQDKYGETSDFAILRSSFNRAINNGNLNEAGNVLEAIREEFSL